MGLRRTFFIAALLGASFSAQAQNDALLGSWENLTQGDLVGLTLKDSEHCNLYLERALKPRTDRACKYEAFEDRYLIFLFNEHGVCNSEADFEFIHEPEAPLVRLIIGGSEVVLSRVQASKDLK
jgi:hypothetical protein